MLVSLGRVGAGICSVSLRRIVLLGLASCATLALGAALVPAGAKAVHNEPNTDLRVLYGPVEDVQHFDDECSNFTNRSAWRTREVEFSLQPNDIQGYQACINKGAAGRSGETTHYLRFINGANPPNGCKRVNFAGVREAKAYLYRNGFYNYQFTWDARTDHTQLVCGLSANDTVEIYARTCYDVVLNDGFINVPGDLIGTAGVARSFGPVTAQSNYRADVNEDMTVNVTDDIFGVASQFGQCHYSGR